MRAANPPEDRVMRALRQANVITAAQFRAAMDLLEATEPCDRCGGTGVEPGTPTAGLEATRDVWGCSKCNGTGEMRAIR